MGVSSHAVVSANTVTAIYPRICLYSYTRENTM